MRRCLIFSFCSRMRFMRSVSSSSVSFSCETTCARLGKRGGTEEVDTHAWSAAGLDAFWIDIRVFFAGGAVCLESSEGMAS